MEKIIACIPNFSEGRNKKTIQAIVEAITQIPGVFLLGQASDPAHHRSVITFAGEPNAVCEAAFAATKRAAELIDLTIHKGEHPRMGATDVIPLVPFQGVTAEECVRLAEKLGEKIGRELHIPVYFYEKAAKRPERENLANIRRGEYEGLKKEIGKNPERDPDFGLKKLGKAGATALGVRDPLIAFNVNLKSNDLEFAKAIAKKIRFKDGGFKGVKALGFALEDKGKVQVSMNLTNYRETPPHIVFEAIQKEAEQAGVEISESEIVGLIPQEALTLGAKHFLKLKGFHNDQILEVILKKKMEQEESGGEFLNTKLKTFLDEVASQKAVPGGGSVAALAGALGASLVSMVARLTLASARYEKVHSESRKILKESEKLRLHLAQLIEEDSKAYGKVMAAYKLPKTSKGRSIAIQKALLYAAEIPAQTAEAILEVMGPLEKISRIGNENAISDCGVALSLLEAGLYGALLNVRINLKAITDQKKRRVFEKRCQIIASRFARRKQKLASLIENKM